VLAPAGVARYGPAPSGPPHVPTRSDLRAVALLGRSRLRHRATGRCRGRRRDLPPGHLPAGPRPRAVERGLRAVLPPPRRRPLRREPQPSGRVLPVPGRAQAVAARCPGPVPGVLAPDRPRPGRPRSALRRGRLGVADPGRLGPGLGGVGRRDGGDPVHLLPAGRRHRSHAGHRRADLRGRAHRDVPAERRQHLRHQVGTSTSPTARSGTRGRSSTRTTTSRRPTRRSTSSCSSATRRSATASSAAA
jgi:hypothetical protein